MKLCSGHVYRRARDHPEEVDLWREWIRQNVPSGSAGYVIEDIDLLLIEDTSPEPWVIIRYYSPRLDPVGKLMAVERKYGNGDMGHAQIRTFGLLDKIARRGDPLRQRWMGYYLLNHPHENPELCDHVLINHKSYTMDEFRKFVKFELDIPPYEFPDYIRI